MKSLIGKCGSAFLLVLLPLWAISIGPASARDENVTGTWDLTVLTDGGEAHPRIVVKQEGERLTGTYRGRMGEVPLTGSLRGREVRFEVRLKFREGDVAVTYSGTVDTDTMKGTVQFGQAGSGSWSAARVKS